MPSDERSALRYRLSYWNRRRRTALLRACELALTGQTGSVDTRPAAARPPSADRSSIEHSVLRHDAAIARHDSPDAPAWLPRAMTIDPAWTYAIRDARVAPESGGVWLESGVAMLELLGGEGRYSGSQDLRGMARRKARERIPGTWALLPNHTYYHFLIEDLPALLTSLAFARETLGVDAGVLVHDTVHPFVSAALSTIDAPVRTTRSAMVSVERLVASGFTTARVHPSSIETTRSHFGLADTPGDRWIYLSRVGFRRSASWEQQLIDAMARELPQVEAVECHRLTLQEQTRLMSTAAGVIAPHGAALSNLVFAPPSARIVEIATPENSCDHFWHLTGQRGMDYTLLWVDGDAPVAETVARIADAIAR